MCDECWMNHPLALEGNNETPARGDAVEEWIERQRDILPKDSVRWHTVNDLLDAYRDHADTGTDLGSAVLGPYVYAEEVFDD